MNNHTDTDNNTAMTVMAGEDVKQLLKDGNFEDLQKTSGETETSPRTSPSAPYNRIWEAGHAIGKYEIVKKIGKGGMGVIYLARHRQLDSLRALKVLPQNLEEENSLFNDRFLREARVASLIRHPNIVEVMDVERDEEQHVSYIVMEFMDGGNLRQIMKKQGRLMLDQAVVIVQSVASALCVAAQHKIVHRDIKPDNIMFTKDGIVKLADLGIAKNDNEDVNLTRTNIMMGTPAYLPPEQAENPKDVDIRSDLYSLGATFFEMLTGLPPYPGKTTFEILHKLYSDPVPNPSELNPEIPADISAVVMKLLAKEPGKRYQTPEQLLEALGKIIPPISESETQKIIRNLLTSSAENSTAASSCSTFTTSFQKTRIRKRRIKTVSAAACILFVLAAGYVMRKKIQEFVFPEKQTPFSASPRRPQKAVNPVIPETETFLLKIHTNPMAQIQLTSSEGKIFSFICNQNGDLEIPDLLSGSYQLKITLADYLELQRKIEIPQQLEQNIQLIPDVRMLRIVSTPGARVELSSQDDIRKSFTVPASGTLDIPELKKRNYRIRITYAGFFPYEKEISLRDNLTLPMQLESIFKTLLLNTIPFAKVELYQNSELRHSETADATGRCLILKIRKGTYEIRLSAPAYESHSSVISFEKDLSLKIPLSRKYYTLSISTQSGVRVLVRRNEKDISDFIMPSSGFNRIDKLTEGRYELYLSKEGFQSRSCMVELRENASVQIALARTERAESVPVKNDPGANLHHIREKGSVKIDLVASGMLRKHVEKYGLQFCAGTQDWVTVKQFPHVIRTDAGKIRIRFKGKGLQPIPDEVVSVKKNETSELTVFPYVHPSRAEFRSNHTNTFFLIGDTRCEQNQEFSMETFREYSVTAVSDSRRLTKKIVCSNPGEKITVEFFFPEIVHPYQKQFDAAFKVFQQKKYEEALPLLLKAAEQKHPEAAYIVAEIYDRGLGMWFSDSKKAREWYFKAADYGHPAAAFHVAEAIRKDSYDGSPEQMLKYYLTAIKAGNAKAAYQVSLFYRDGYRSIAADENQALSFLKQAADRGYPDAMFDLGIRYEKGIGIPANSKSALYWINKAAQAGYEKAQRYKENLQ